MTRIELTKRQAAALVFASAVMGAGLLGLAMEVVSACKNL